MSDLADAAKKKAQPTPTPMATPASSGTDKTTYTGQSKKGSTGKEQSTRVTQARKEGEMSDKAAVREGMNVDLAAAARRAAEKRATATPTPASKKASSKSAGGSR